MDVAWKEFSERMQKDIFVTKGGNRTQTGY